MVTGWTGLLSILVVSQLSCWAQMNLNEKLLGGIEVDIKVDLEQVTSFLVEKITNEQYSNKFKKKHSKHSASVNKINYNHKCHYAIGKSISACYFLHQYIFRGLYAIE